MSATPEHAPIVRTERLEVVDRQGRVRVVVGDLGWSGEVPGVGLVLLDAHGTARAWIGLGEHGPELVFDQGGNAVVELGVDDPTSDALHVGAYVQLSDAEGRPSVACRVEADGRVTFHMGEQGP